MPFRQNGFALILTLGLLTLLMLTLYGVSALVKVSGRIATVQGYHLQARQNALLGLDVALAELSRHTRDTTRLTGMAGVTGISANSANRTRHWCGVWHADGTFVTWLASGSAANATIITEVIDLVAQGSVGAPTANSEPVSAGKVAILEADLPGQPRGYARTGSYAYAVMDEGVKIPVYVLGAGLRPEIFANSATTAAGRLRDAVLSFESKLALILSYEQLALLPTPGAALSPSTLQDNFHHVTLRTDFVGPGGKQTGLVNVNTNSMPVWRSLLQTYNASPGVTAPLTAGMVASKGAAIVSGLATYSGSGKDRGAPFQAVTSVGDYLETIFPSTDTPTASEIMAVIGRMLAVRSDTFRIRAYGEAVNPVESAQIESSVFCEAIVQRREDGYFSVVYFRWLGRDDI